MLALEGVSAAYERSAVVSGVALTVAAGEAVALLGRNGVGKTTLLRTIAGLHEAVGGSVRFDGRDITRFPPFRRARLGIGYVPQGRGIFSHLTVEENLAVGSAAVGMEPRARTAAVLDFFPALTRLYKRKGGVLSGGEQQQLALARALVLQPALLLLDEPTEGIAPAIVADIELVLGRIRREMHIAILIVEQHLDFAWAIAERYYVMQRGKLVAQGRTQDAPSETIVRFLSV